MPFWYQKSFSVTSDDFARSFRPSKLCSDLAFWKDRCLNDSQDASKYVESRRCSTYRNGSFLIKQCQNNEIYCPNKGKCLADVNDCEAHFYFGNETQCLNQNMHHCHESNQCIWKDWVCDGFIQCLQGDDEDFNLCYERRSFAEGATFKCTEAKRFGYDVTILATKCNDIEECKDGIDEDGCQNDDSSGLISIGILFLAIAVIWITIFLKFADDAIPQESKYDHSLSDLKGDRLCVLKVSSKNCLEF